MWPQGAGEEGERDLPLLESGRGMMRAAAAEGDEAMVVVSADASLLTPVALLRNEAAFGPVDAADRKQAEEDLDRIRCIIPCRLR